MCRMPLSFCHEVPGCNRVLSKYKHDAVVQLFQRNRSHPPQHTVPPSSSLLHKFPSRSRYGTRQSICHVCPTRLKCCGNAGQAPSLKSCPKMRETWCEYECCTPLKPIQHKPCCLRFVQRPTGNEARGRPERHHQRCLCYTPDRRPLSSISDYHHMAQSRLTVHAVSYR